MIVFFDFFLKQQVKYKKLDTKQFKNCSIYFLEFKLQKYGLFLNFNNQEKSSVVRYASALTRCSLNLLEKQL